MPTTTTYPGCTQCCPSANCAGCNLAGFPPATLHATFASGGSPSCPCASGTIALSYSGFDSVHSAQSWTGTGSFGCGHNITIKFECNATTSFIIYQFPDGCGANSLTGGQLAGQCSPFTDTFSLTTGAGNICGGCTGTFQCQITL